MNSPVRSPSTRVVSLAFLKCMCLLKESVSRSLAGETFRLSSPGIRHSTGMLRELESDCRPRPGALMEAVDRLLTKSRKFATSKNSQATLIFPISHDLQVAPCLLLNSSKSVWLERTFTSARCSEASQHPPSAGALPANRSTGSARPSKAYARPFSATLYQLDFGGSGLVFADMPPEGCAKYPLRVRTDKWPWPVASAFTSTALNFPSSASSAGT
jgi:hypothetical protein